MRGRPFEKGNKHGKGRPRGSGHIERCRKWADEKGFAFLERVAEGVEPGFKSQYTVRVQAAEYLIDRGYGKPRPQDDPEGTLGMTIGEFLASAVEPKENHAEPEYRAN